MSLLAATTVQVFPVSPLQHVTPVTTIFLALKKKKRKKRDKKEKRRKVDNITISAIVTASATHWGMVDKFASTIPRPEKHSYYTDE